MRFGSERRRRLATDSMLADSEALQLAEEAPPLVDRAAGVDWYSRPGTEVDLAAHTLCLLRRARAGASGGTMHGDEAVRRVLAAANPEAVVWLASRAISYLDETGFPEDVEPWFRDR